MSTARVRKAVFPVAGLGTRFIPATKAMPKEMLPIVDKPLIQYAVEEAVAAGCTDMVFVTGRGKRAIEDHFDKAFEMEAQLEAQGKTEMLAVLRAVVPKHVSCVYVRQAEPLGLGHAILCAQPVVGDEPFAVILADDLVDAKVPVLAQMVAVHMKQGHSVVGVQRIKRSLSRNYGVVAGSKVESALYRLGAIVEKPSPSEAPSNLGVVGRYILDSAIFRHLSMTGRGAGGEIQLTDGIGSLLKERPVFAYEFSGTRYDCGSKLGYLQANLAYGLRHPEAGRDFSRYLRRFGVDPRKL